MSSADAAAMASRTKLLMPMRLTYSTSRSRLPVNSSALTYSCGRTRRAASIMAAATCSGVPCALSSRTLWNTAAMRCTYTRMYHHSHGLSCGARPYRSFTQSPQMTTSRRMYGVLAVTNGTPTASGRKCGTESIAAHSAGSSSGAADGSCAASGVAPRPPAFPPPAAATAAATAADASVAQRRAASLPGVAAPLVVGTSRAHAALRRCDSGKVRNASTVPATSAASCASSCQSGGRSHAPSPRAALPPTPPVWPPPPPPPPLPLPLPVVPRSRRCARGRLMYATCAVPARTRAAYACAASTGSVKSISGSPFQMKPLHASTDTAPSWRGTRVK